MVVFESVKNFFELILSPLQSLFGFFPPFKVIVSGILFLSLSYFGWRAIK